MPHTPRAPRDVRAIIDEDDEHKRLKWLFGERMKRGKGTMERGRKVSDPDRHRTILEDA